MTLIINKWDKYNRLTIIKEVEQKKTHRYFLCECQCWIIKSYALLSLRHWRSKSCWCYLKDFPSNKTHWMRTSKIYGVWSGIKQRCNNKKSKVYLNYWWRWINVEWENFEEFYNDMWNTYKKWLEIDRKNNDWNYCKKNCRWTTKKINIRNRRNTIQYKWKSLMEWCEELNLSYHTVYQRINRWNWNIEKALQI